MSKLQNYSGSITWAFAALSLSLVGCSSKDSNNNGGQSSAVCTQGATRECVGPAACKGAQICQTDLSWTTCDCGPSGTGGGAATGGASAVNSSNTDVGGTASATGGAPTVATGGATSSAATGGAPGVATGGTPGVATGGTPGVATGGTPGVATGGTASAGGSSANTFLTSVDGWIVDAAHALQGPVFTYADSGGSNITPNCVTGTCFKSAGTTTEFCVTGQVAKALDQYGDSCQLTSDLCVWSKYWGAAVAINPNQTPTATDASAWDASKYTGISFKATVNTLPPNLRVYLNLIDGSQFCYQFTATKTYSLLWSQFHTDCYTTGGSAPTAANLAQVKSIAWQAGTNASQVGFFDFCVAEVKILP